MTEIMPVPRILILLSYQQGASLVLFPVLEQGGGTVQEKVLWMV